MFLAGGCNLSKPLLKDYFEYYERCRTHLSLEKDAPVGRAVEPRSHGDVIQIPKVGGLHHLYKRKAPDSKSASKHLQENSDLVVRSFAMPSSVFGGRTLAA